MPSESSANHPPKPEFVAVKTAVMKGAEHICTARSTSMAQRIAHALNRYFNPRFRTASKGK